jgi:hypothetical protein
MLKRFRSRVARFLRRNLEDYFGGPMHRLERYAAKQTREQLRFTADAERGRLADIRQMPPTEIPRECRRTPAEERRRIDDMPIP